MYACWPGSLSTRKEYQGSHRTQKPALNLLCGYCVLLGKQVIAHQLLM